MKNTNILEKIAPSIINASVAIILSLPILSLHNITLWKISAISLFFLYNLYFLVFNENICLGMMICNTRWKKQVSFKNEFIYIVLYTISFSTLFFWVWFPFDIFLINIFILQLTTVLITGTTLHAYLTGKDSTFIKA